MAKCLCGVHKLFPAFELKEQTEQWLPYGEKCNKRQYSHQQSPGCLSYLRVYSSEPHEEHKSTIPEYGGEGKAYKIFRNVAIFRFLMQEHHNHSQQQYPYPSYIYFPYSHVIYSFNEEQNTE